MSSIADASERIALKVNAPVPLRRLVVACEERMPAACQGLANERPIIGRLLYTRFNAHRRHAHLGRLQQVFKGIDALLNSCNASTLRDLLNGAVQRVDSDPHIGSQASIERVDHEETIADGLSRILRAIHEQAATLKSRTQAACKVFCALLARQFFVPFSLAACSLLGRVFSLAGEIVELAETGNSALTSLLMHGKQTETQKEGTLVLPMRGPGQMPHAEARHEMRAVLGDVPLLSTACQEGHGDKYTIAPATGKPRLEATPIEGPSRDDTEKRVPSVKQVAPAEDILSWGEDLGEPVADAEFHPHPPHQSQMQDVLSEICSTCAMDVAEDEASGGPSTMFKDSFFAQCGGDEQVLEKSHEKFSSQSRPTLPYVRRAKRAKGRSMYGLRRKEARARVRKRKGHGLSCS